MTNLNNKKLKKLLKSKSRVKIEQNPDMFYKEFLKSEVFVPVIYRYKRTGKGKIPNQVNSCKCDGIISHIGTV